MARRVKLLCGGQAPAVEDKWLYLLCVHPVQNRVSLSLQHWDRGKSTQLLLLKSPQNLYDQVDCSDNTAVFAHCFPHTLLGMFLDGIPFCEFKPLEAIQSNRLGVS